MNRCRCIVLCLCPVLLLWAVNGLCAQPVSTDLPRAPELLVNGGFEDMAAGQAAPMGWRLDINNGAKVSMTIDQATFHGGGRSVRLASQSGMTAHVYGRFVQSVPVQPNTEYVLSAWVKGEQVAADQHFTDWKSYTLGVRAGTFDWYEVSTRITTRPDQTTLDIGLNVVNQAGALWLDDVCLTGAVDMLQSTRDDVRAALLAPAKVQGDRVECELRLYLDTPDDFEGTVDVWIDELFHRRQALTGGSQQLRWTWSSGDTIAQRLRCTVLIADPSGQRVAHGEKQIEKISGRVVLDQLHEVQRRLSTFAKQLEAVRDTGTPVDYPLVTKTVVENFLRWAREDVQNGELTRAQRAASDMLDSLERAAAEFEAPRGVPRYRTGALDIEGLSFVGDVKLGSTTARRPVFFCGYGHFDSVRRDIELFPDYGVNIIQIEIGPHHVLTAEDYVDDTRLQNVLSVLDRAARSNIMVNLLLSPHYFPQWAREKRPHLTRCSGGSLRFCIDALESRALIEQFLRIVIPRIKDKPALHSLCLSNEPVYTNSADCSFTQDKWCDYLQRVHGTVEAMNERLGTAYEAFADVPIPGNVHYDAPQFYDWCRFNQERFADWNRWMADVIHEMWPDIPLHAKVMASMFSRSAVADGTDAQMFVDLGRISGNDCSNDYPGPGEWAQSWQTQNMYYDLQRSLGGKPIFNSENHLSRDRSTHYYPPGHFRTALWQGAIHGQGATTLWVWQRTYDPKHDFYGNVMHRPGCAEAVGRTCLDLNRLALQVTALQHASAPLAICYSMPSLIHNAEYPATIDRVYRGLNFCGVAIDFIGQEQIAAGKLADYRLLLLPQTTHETDATVRGIGRFVESGGSVAIMGDEALRYDEYNNPRPPVTWLKAPTDVVQPDADARQLRAIFRDRLEALNALPHYDVIDSTSNALLWGVEWRVAQHEGHTLVNAVNLTKQPMTVHLRPRDGTVVKALDLLTSGKCEEQWELPPLQPRLWRVID